MCLQVGSVKEWSLGVRELEFIPQRRDWWDKRGGDCQVTIVYTSESILIDDYTSDWQIRVNEGKIIFFYCLVSAGQESCLAIKCEVSLNNSTEFSAKVVNLTQSCDSQGTYNDEESCNKYPDLIICLSAGSVKTFPLVVLITPGFNLDSSTK